MEDSVELLLDEILREAGAGALITPAWIRERYGVEHADTLEETLRLAGVLHVVHRVRDQDMGPFRLLHEVGRGGMGTVYLAEITEAFEGMVAGQRCAVKLLHPHLVDEPHVQERFLLEGSIGREIDHPNVVHGLAACRVETDRGPELCLFMDYVQGDTLAALMRKGHAVSEPLCRIVGLEMARALEAIHERGVVHCDVKPQNILIAVDGRVCLMDLGVAQLAAHRDEDVFSGSLRYAAPEQFEVGREIDGRADLYALGRTLLELAEGVEGADGAPARLPPRFSPFLRAVVEGLSAPAAEDRLGSARLLRSIMEGGEESEWWQQRKQIGNGHEPVVEASTGRLHGRREEAARLEMAHFLSNSAGGRCVLIQGVAGIGKSRLVRDFLDRQVGSRTILGSYAPEGQPNGHSALAAAFREIPAVATLVAALPTRVRAAVSEWFGAAPVEIKAELDSIAAGLVGVLRAVTAEGPVVIWLDDLHFASNSDLKLIGSLSMALRTEPCLLVGTMRPTVNPIWRESIRGYDHVVWLELGPIDHASMRRLLSDASGPRQLAASAIEDLAWQSGGVPLLGLTQLRSPRLQRSLVLHRRGVWHLPSGATSIEGPRALHETIAARLGELDTDERRVLEVASCLGAEFDADVIASVLTLSPDRLVAVLARLEDVHGLVHWGELRSAFAHHLHCEQARASLPPQRRRQYHAAIAECLAAHDAGESPPSVICLHALRGGLTGLARAHLPNALASLTVGFQWEHVLEITRLALDTKGFLLGAERMAAVRARSQALACLGQLDEHLELLAEQLVLAGRGGDAVEIAEAHLDLANHWAARHDYEKVLGYLRGALRVLGRRGDQHTRTRVLSTWAHLERSRGRLPAAVKAAKAGITSAQACGDQRLEANLTVTLASATMDRSTNWDEVRRLFERAIELAGDTSNKTHCVALGHLALIDLEFGNRQSAYERMQSGFEASLGMGERQLIAIFRGRMANMARNRGRLGEAVEGLRHGLSDCADIEERLESAYQHHQLGGVAMDLGDWRLAREMLEAGLAIAEEIGDARFSAFIPGELALVEWRGGAREIARRLIEKSLVGMRRNGDERAIHERELIWARTLFLDGEEGAMHAFLAAFRPSSLLAGPGQDYRAGITQCWRAVCLGEDASEVVALIDKLGPGLPRLSRMEIGYLLWSTGCGARFLTAAQEDLLYVVRHAPEQYRESMLREVPLYGLIHAGVRLQDR